MEYCGATKLSILVHLVHMNRLSEHREFCGVHCWQLFPNRPTVAFRTNKSTRKQLTRARLENSNITHKIDRELNLLCEPLLAPNQPRTQATCRREKWPGIHCLRMRKRFRKFSANESDYGQVTRGCYADKYPNQIYGLQRGSCVYTRRWLPLSVVYVLLRRSQSTRSEFLLLKERSRAGLGAQACCWKYRCLQTMASQLFSAAVVEVNCYVQAVTTTDDGLGELPEDERARSDRQEANKSHQRGSRSFSKYRFVASVR